MNFILYPLAAAFQQHYDGISSNFGWVYSLELRLNWAVFSGQRWSSAVNSKNMFLAIPYNLFANYNWIQIMAKWHFICKWSTSLWLQLFKITSVNVLPLSYVFMYVPRHTWISSERVYSHFHVRARLTSKCPLCLAKCDSKTSQERVRNPKDKSVFRPRSLRAVWVHCWRGVSTP